MIAPHSIRLLYRFLIVSLPVTLMADQAPHPINDFRRIVFLGDSITQAGDYAVDINCWLLTQGDAGVVLKVGLSSESATDLTADENLDHKAIYGFPRPLLSHRLKRTLELTKPDLLFVCYGMNDGHAMQNNPAAPERYAAAITTLRETALSSGVREVVFLTPPIHDPGPGVTEDDPHDRNLALFSEWLISKRKDGWKVVDLHGPMRRALDEARKKQPGFKFQKDGVHPQREGHWLMAREVLSQYFGANVAGISSSEQFFPANGAEIRKEVDKAVRALQSAYLLKIGHERPGVPGGPDSKKGPSIEDAQSIADTITNKIKGLMGGDHALTNG